jgi:hypothetical protein
LHTTHVLLLLLLLLLLAAAALQPVAPVGFAARSASCVSRACCCRALNLHLICALPAAQLQARLV